MKAKAVVHLFSGATAATETTREALKDFWQRREKDICAAVVDINMRLWFYSHETGWERALKFRYVPGRPELWHQELKAGDLKPTTMTPFDYA